MEGYEAGNYSTLSVPVNEEVSNKNKKDPNVPYTLTVRKVRETSTSWTFQFSLATAIHRRLVMR